MGSKFIQFENLQISWEVRANWFNFKNLEISWELGAIYLIRKFRNQLIIEHWPFQGFWTPVQLSTKSPAQYLAGVSLPGGAWF